MTYPHPRWVHPLPFCRGQRWMMGGWYACPEPARPSGLCGAHEQAEAWREPEMRAVALHVRSTLTLDPWGME